MENCERDMGFEKILSKFKELNPNINIDSNITKLQTDLQIIYNIYNEIEKGRVNIDDKTKIKNLFNNKENGIQIDYLLIAKMIFYNKKYFKFIPRKIQIISLLYFLEKDKKMD